MKRIVHGAAALAALVGLGLLFSPRAECADYLSVSDQALPQSDGLEGYAPGAGCAQCGGYGAGCGACGLGCGTGASGAYCPLLTVSAGAVILHRSAPNSRTLVEDAVTSEEVIDAEDLGLDWSTGARFGLIWNTSYGWQIEAAYFGIDGWTATAEAAGDLRIPFFVPRQVFEDLFIEYGSDLFSAEVNLRRPVSCRVTALAGFRWIGLREHIFADALQPQAYSWADLDLDNDLFGFQIGADVLFWEQPCGRLRIDGFLKAGVYGNSVERRFVGGGVFGDGAVYEADDSHAAFAGEIAARASYKLTDWLSVFGGYELLWLDGVALAPSQQVGLEDIAFGGSVFYHGALAGLEARW